MQGVASLGRRIGAGLLREAWDRGRTPRVGNRCIVADSLQARGDTAAPCCQETQGMMLPLASLSLTSDYGDELWALPVHRSVSISPLIREAYNGYDAGHTLYQGEGQ